jgi:hypothetical protein
MRLDELQGVRSHVAATFKKVQDVVDYLEDRGFDYLGSGSYGAVFDHPSFDSRYVLKVFKDPFYEQFLNYAIKNRQDPHMPKIIGKVIRLPGYGAMVRIEVLREMSDQQYRYMRLHDQVDHIQRRFYGVPMVQAEIDIFNSNNAKFHLESLMESIENLLRAKPAGSHLDLHEGNFMYRDTTIVISDPYSGSDIPFSDK